MLGMAWVVRGEFRKLWIGQLVSASGSAITTVALPLVAVVTLHVSAVQMGLLAALTVAPHLVLGLPAGVWVDIVEQIEPDPAFLNGAARDQLAAVTESP